MSPTNQPPTPHPTQQTPWQYSSLSDDEAPIRSEADESDLLIRSPAPSDIEAGPENTNGTANGQRNIIPVWMREASSSFHWKWVPLPIRTFARFAVDWSQGPDPPQIQQISPWFPKIQEAPVKLIDHWLPRRRQKAGLLAAFYAAWLLTFSSMVRHSALSGEIQGYGVPSRIWCGYSHWSNNNGCGLNGNECRPFQGSSFAFRCPADCLNVHLSTPHAVGDQEANYSRLVIGGSPIPSLTNTSSSTSSSAAGNPVYRADSFICQAAIHAGAIKNELGGCGVVSLVGHRDGFAASTRHGVQSYAFDSDFPKAFAFETDLNAACGVVDLRWPLLAVTVVFTALLSLCTASPLVFFASLFAMLFFHVGLVSDPPNLFDQAALFSRIVERFLPAAFVAVVVYRYCVQPQLAGCRAHVEKTMLWLGGAWVGALNNHTFDFIPIQRLTPSDLAAQPGARLALVLIVLVIFAIALGQVWYLRLEGRFPRYLAIYAIFGVVLITCVIIPNLNLRIHHYILALLLLPGTRVQTRPSLFYQGLLVGLFINGVARWGFDSILQTSAALYQGGPVKSLLPNITQPTSIGLTDIAFGWDEPPEPYDGISVLVNDVERHRWYMGEREPEWKWIKPLTAGPQYFRFAYMRGSEAADYTKAGVWDVREGSWSEMEAGPSR